MIKTPLELYKHLDQSNCRRCLLPSCMAFSVAVIQGQKKLSDCPLLSTEKINDLSGGIVQKKSMKEEQDAYLASLQEEIDQHDLSDIASRLDLPLKEETVGIKCLGKYFWIDAQGGMASECHCNNWVHIPILHYLLQSKGLQPAGEWIDFPALKDAGGKERFFAHRCEESMQQLVDEHTELFFEILDLFEAEEVRETEADKARILYPLPKVPFLINYWESEESFPSKLNILFDSKVSENTNVESVYMIGRGMVEMFHQLIIRHSSGELF
ncbi:MAG: DUF3786 domain-containing protein [Candidatus Electrothrix communis]|nr:MAG: DUF3786 domain-containing protein [Candidatus Electrothrix communis]